MSSAIAKSINESQDNVNKKIDCDLCESKRFASVSGNSAQVPYLTVQRSGRGRRNAYSVLTLLSSCRRLPVRHQTPPAALICLCDKSR